MFDWKDFFNDFADRYYSVPDFTNEEHVYALQNYLIEQGMLTEDVDYAIKTLLGEAPTDPRVAKQAKKLGLVSLGYGNWGKEKGGPTTHTNVDGKLEPVGDKKDDDKDDKEKEKEEPKANVVSKDAVADRGKNHNTDVNPDYQRDVGKPEGEKNQEKKFKNSVAIDKLNNPKFGVEAKIDTALKKGDIGDGDAENMENFQPEMEDFLKKPTKQKAQELTKKYQLSQNQSGSKLYVGILGGNNRKILGEGNALINEMSKVLNNYVPLKELGNIKKKSQTKLVAASKPELKTVRKAKDDIGVKKLFSNKPYNRLKERFHQVFGPVGDDGNLLRPSNKYSTEYFRQSVGENEALDKTIQVCKELESEGTSKPEFRKALQRHKKTMEDIAKRYDKIKPEERRAIVEQSYSDMARGIHEADPEGARSLMKNMAEMALYDSELAGGDEVYLPSDGQFPSADKMRVDRDGKDVVEKVAGVSVKFGKRNGVYGFPGESAQYQKFHPDEDKRTYMRNRVGHKGHALGVRDDLIEDKTKFDKMLDESGLSDTIQNSEEVRTKLLGIQSQINEARSKIENEDGRYTTKDLVRIRKQLEKFNKDATSVLKENVDFKALKKMMGRVNSNKFMEGATEAINIISMASVLNTSNGLSVLEHNHQTIDKDGLNSETDKGTTNLNDWSFAFRSYDARGGGLMAGFKGKK